MSKKNIMATHAVEAMGLRTISMYVQEFFHWGWQPYAQENDNGIDGEIIPRFKNGNDMGVRIYVQSKAGSGYLSSRNDNFVNISPYASANDLKIHLDRWSHYLEPVIIVYTNAERIDKNGNKYVDIKNPQAWWIRVDKDYQYDDSTLIHIPVSNLFQEHTKGQLEKLIKPYIKDWIHYPKLVISKKDLYLWYSENLAIDAKKYYESWREQGSIITFNQEDVSVKISRVGWRHITNKRRKERVSISKKLLPVAKMILDHHKEIRPVVLKSSYQNTLWKSQTMHIGYRARVDLDGIERKVQVVLKRYINDEKNTEKWWFYSVHIVK